MKKILILAGFFLVLVAVSHASAQDRPAVGAAEVNGTFRSYFSGKYKGNYNEIKILALGRGRLRVAFELTYPYSVNGELTANTGAADGEALIDGDTAVYTSEEYGQCAITIKFVKPGAIKVTQTGECGFGHNVSADGVYKKSSGVRPKFSAP